MPDWLPYLIATVVGILAAAIGWIIKKAWPFLRKVTHFFDDLMGEPERPGVPERPGIMSRLETIEGRLGGVEHEVKTNHGSSLKDAVKRVEQKQILQGEQLDEQSDQLAELHEQYVRPTD